MTTTVDEDTTGVNVEADDSDDEGNEKVDGRKNRTRDFSKFSESHQSLANYVNSNPEFQAAGLPTLTPGQVKALLALRTDWADTPQRKAEREARKAEREAEKAEFVGMTDEEIKSEKAARRAEKQAAKLQAKIDEALAKARAIREGKDASGADLVAAVEAQQNGSVENEDSTESEDKPRRRIGRNR